MCRSLVCFAALNIIYPLLFHLSSKLCETKINILHQSFRLSPRQVRININNTLQITSSLLSLVYEKQLETRLPILQDQNHCCTGEESVGKTESKSHKTFLPLSKVSFSWFRIHLVSVIFCFPELWKNPDQTQFLIAFIFIISVGKQELGTSEFAILLICSIFLESTSPITFLILANDNTIQSPTTEAWMSTWDSFLSPSYPTFNSSPKPIDYTFKVSEDWVPVKME